MDEDVDNGPVAQTSESTLADVTGIPIAELLAPDATVLDNAMRRMIVELNGPQEISAAFTNRAG